MSDERGGRYFREARFFLAGDKVAAQSHILEARSLMGYMRDMQALGGPPIQVKYATLQDGTQIKATMMNGQYQAEIISPLKSDVPQRRLCAPFFSGLYAPRFSRKHTRQTSPNTPPDEIVGVEWLYPAPHVLDSMLAVYPGETNRVAPVLYAVDDTPELTLPPGDSPTYGRPPATLAKVFASAYSGEMRSAIQLLLGMGVRLATEIDVEAGTYTYAFDYGYTGTVGLVKVPGGDPDYPEFWMVRFPRDGHGMLAMRYPVCYEVSKLQRDTGMKYTPDPGVQFPRSAADIAARKDDGALFEVMSLAAFDAIIDGYSPCYESSGWAFSKSGHECQNVLITSVAAPGNKINATTRRVKFSFAFGVGHALEVSGEVVEEAACHTVKTAAPRYPFEGMFTSLLPHPDIYADSDNTSVVAPVHVYYLEDAEQVWRLDSQLNQPDLRESNLPGCHAALAWCPGEYYGRYWASGASTITYTLNGGGVITRPTLGVSSANRYDWYTNNDTAKPNYLIVGGSGTSPAPYRAVKLATAIWMRTWLETDRTNNPSAAMYVPFYQREGVYILDAYTDVEQAATDNRSFDGFTTTGVTSLLLRTFAEDGLSSVLSILTTELEPGASLSSCPGCVGTYSAGGIGLSALTGDWDSLSGPGIVVPSDIPGVTEASTQSYGAFKFYGGANVVVASMSPSETAAALVVTDTTSTTAYGYTDALLPDKYILAKLNPTESADFITNTEYVFADSPGIYYHFIGLANTIGTNP